MRIPSHSPLLPTRRSCPLRLLTLAAATAFAVASLASTGLAEEDLSPEVQAQIADILSIKDTFTPAEQKMSSNLVFLARQARGENIGVAAARLLSGPVPESVQVDVRAKKVSGKLRTAVTALGATILSADKPNGRLSVSVAPATLTDLAANDAVLSVRTPGRPTTNVGSLATQGIIGHRTKQATAQTGFNGAGIKVGVLSDTASPTRVAALIASGDLGPNTIVLPGQSGGAGSDEGTAMMEIVQDMAPGAQIYFATAFSGETGFANNIKALADQGCSVIVDDVSYSNEAAFQDGIIAQAVNEVTGRGVLYFSSAANSGNIAHGTSGTWEGDFSNGGTYTTPVNSGNTKTYQVHRFQTTPSAQNYDVIKVLGNTYFDFTWSDPLGTSANDYDMFVLDTTGATLKAFSVDTQNGTQDPIEEVAAVNQGGNYNAPAAGDRVVFVKTTAAAARALRLDTNRGQLTIATVGSTKGHNAAANTVSCAATFWDSAKTGTKAFNGASNPCETFSSDGPRKVFYNPNGSAITAGNFLFGTGGGVTLQKPDVTAADGVVTATPGFKPFFGTSAAAPHAAGIAALIRSARPNLSNGQILNVLLNTSLDNEAPGVDPTGGYGVLNAQAAMQAVLQFPAQ